MYGYEIRAIQHCNLSSWSFALLCLVDSRCCSNSESWMRRVILSNAAFCQQVLKLLTKMLDIVQQFCASYLCLFCFTREKPINYFCCFRIAPRPLYNSRLIAAFRRSFRASASCWRPLSYNVLVSSRVESTLYWCKVGIMASCPNRLRTLPGVLTS